MDNANNSLYMKYPKSLQNFKTSCTLWGKPGWIETSGENPLDAGRRLAQDVYDNSERYNEPNEITVKVRWTEPSAFKETEFIFTFEVVARIELRSSLTYEVEKEG
jgi:hypothetical protein